jgi:uncharacterized membrane protein
MGLPPLEGMHPLVVHFPIAFLLTVWIPALISLVNRKHGYQWMLVTFLWFAVGVIGVFAAVFTGEAAEEIVVVTSEAMKHAVHEHEEAGEFVRTVMALGFLVFAALTIWVGLKKPKKGLVVMGALITLAIYATGAVKLIDTAHEGGVLVHEYGIHAPISGGVEPVDD